MVRDGLRAVIARSLAPDRTGLARFAYSVRVHRRHVGAGRGFGQGDGQEFLDADLARVLAQVPIFPWWRNDANKLGVQVPDTHGQGGVSGAGLRGNEIQPLLVAAEIHPD